MMTAVVAALYVAYAVAAGYWLGCGHTNALWADRARLGPGHKECDGKIYWVVDMNDEGGCARLRDVIEAQQDARERTAFERGMRAWT